MIPFAGKARSHRNRRLTLEHREKIAAAMKGRHYGRAVLPIDYPQGSQMEREVCALRGIKSTTEIAEMFGLSRRGVVSNIWLKALKARDQGAAK